MLGNLSHHKRVYVQRLKKYQVRLEITNKLNLTFRKYNRREQFFFSFAALNNQNLLSSTLSNQFQNREIFDLRSKRFYSCVDSLFEGLR